MEKLELNEKRISLLFGTFPLIAYILGISILFIVVTTLVIFSREWISKKINKNCTVHYKNRGDNPYWGRYLHDLVSKCVDLNKR